MLNLKKLYLVLGIILIVLGLGFVWFSNTILQLYFSGPETCTTGVVVDGVPTCASIVAAIGTYAAIGGFLFGLGPLFLFMGRTKAAMANPR